MSDSHPHHHDATRDDTRDASRDVRLDVVVVGGGVAGLSAALALGRARRRVVVVDAGEPRNAPAAHMHGVLGLDGVPPLELLARGRDEVGRYGVEIVDGRATGARRVDGGFEIDVDGGATLVARRLIVTTGLVDHLPDVVGLAERWGRDVVHCPYCHGWEVRDTAIAVVADHPMAAHAALLFRQWSDRVALFTNGASPLSADDHRTLTARGIPVIDVPIDRIVVVDDRIVGVRLTDGDEYAADTVAVGARTVASSPVLDALGVGAVAHPFHPDLGTTYHADPNGATSVAGVFAAGNVVDPSANVPMSIAAGFRAGAFVNADLVEEENRDAVAAAAEHPVMDERFWDDRYRSAPALWSGKPNATLVAEAGDWSPGTAIDVGAGEGADAIWLAEQGWTVTGQEVSSVAIERASTHAADAGEPIASRITWAHGDIATLDLATYDLVTSHYVHVASGEREPFVRRLAELVAPGGRLMIVAHHPSDLATNIRRPRRPDLFATAAQLAALLDDRFSIVTAEARPRGINDADGNPVTIRDTVLVAERVA
jgi:thioredoxin reductase/SAM-dependent methyltransferase